MPTHPLDATPVVTFRTDPDAGDHWHVCLGAYRGAERQERHAAEADRDALSQALAPLLGLAARVDALLASPDARDAVMRHPHNPTSAVLAVLRWVRGPAGEAASEQADGDGPPSTLRPGDAPTLDRVIAGAGCAIVAGEEGDL